MDKFWELKQKLYEGLRQNGFAEANSEILGYLDVMKKGCVEISAVPRNEGGIRVDIFVPSSQIEDEAYRLSTCGGRHFVSAIETPIITGETFASGLEKVISLAGKRIN